MSQYKVYFYYNLYNANPFVNPNAVVEVKVPAGTEREDIVKIASKELNDLPEVYSYSVYEVKTR